MKFLPLPKHSIDGSIHLQLPIHPTRSPAGMDYPKPTARIVKIQVSRLRNVEVHPYANALKILVATIVWIQHIQNIPNMIWSTMAWSVRTMAGDLGAENVDFRKNNPMAFLWAISYGSNWSAWVAESFEIQDFLGLKYSFPDSEIPIPVFRH